MKKIAEIIMTVVLALTLVGCSNVFNEDKTPAIIEVSTSTGLATVTKSVNGSNKSRSGQQLAIDFTDSVNLEIGENCNVHFYCEACGCDINETLDCPSAKSFHCNCPVETDNKGNSREYYCLKVQVPQTDK